VSGPRLAVPPGRAGRLWLDRRLDAARRGADLLDRKLRILQAELGTLRKEAERTGQRWGELSVQADRTLLIAAQLGGERAIRLASAAGEAQVSIGYQVTIGVRRPAAGIVLPPSGQPWSGQPAEQARKAHIMALEAAVTYAVAAQALRVIEGEATATRYRLRAIRDRLIPALERARAEAALAIDELERADAARLRRAGAAGTRPWSTASAG
jgi:V/A-type H+/Na+-transporting ATPase subunit D